MNIERNSVSEFRYSSSMPATRESVFDVGTANNEGRNIRITDLKMTCGTPGRTIKFYVASYASAGKALEFDLPAYSATDFIWEIPYKFNIVGSTGENRNLFASATGTGVKYVVSGYIEK